VFSPILFYFMLAGIGVATGTLTGLTGASGMSILISLLLLAGVDIRQVIGLTFVVTLVNAIFSVGQYWKHGNVDRRVAVVVGIPAALLVPGGHQLGGALRPGVLTGVMVVFLFGAGVRLLRSPENPEPREGASGEGKRIWPLLVMGLVLGVVMGIVGGGGGVFMAAVFILFLGMPTRAAIGTSVLIMGISAVPGVVAHWADDTLPWAFAAAIAIPSIPAALGASRAANHINPAYVKRILGTYLVIISPLLAAKYFWAG